MEESDSRVLTFKGGSLVPVFVTIYLLSFFTLLLLFNQKLLQVWASREW
jgi:hypothetical protein